MTALPEINAETGERTPRRRPEPPPLEFQPPDCPMCCEQTSVDADGYLVCEACDAYWSLAEYLEPTTGQTGPGHWADPSQPQCNHGEGVEVCVRTVHDDGWHHLITPPIVDVELPEPCPS